jgi:hypothetical protein
MANPKVGPHLQTIHGGVPEEGAGEYEVEGTRDAIPRLAVIDSI